MPANPPLQYTDLVILAKGRTVLAFAIQIHKDFVQRLKCARIWGKKNTMVRRSREITSQRTGMLSNCTLKGRMQDTGSWGWGKQN